MRFLKKLDPAVHTIIVNETNRQRDGVELIASENTVSPAVLEALGSTLTNKYSEGMPNKRYYGGNEFIDDVENLAVERAKKLFGAEHVNVQPYSGSPANMEAYFALCEFGDTLMGMDLAQGGHLTHGHKVNFSGKAYNFIQYGVDKESELIDMDEVRKLALKTNPKLILSGATAYPREIDFKAFHEIAEEVGAYSMVDMSHIAGLVAGGEHISPFPFTDVVTTTTHKTLRGPRGAMILCRVEDRLKEKYHPKDKFTLAERIDRAVFPGMQGGPHDHATAAKAVAFGEALKPDFKEYAKQIKKNAKAMAEELMDRGFRLVSGGTDNHLLLVDVTDKGVSGKKAELILEEAGLYCNKNMVPFDTRSPWNPSGIRLGTPAITTRGMKEEESRIVAQKIDEAILARKDSVKLAKVREDIRELARSFPLYPELD